MAFVGLQLRDVARRARTRSEYWRPTVAAAGRPDSFDTPAGRIDAWWWLYLPLLHGLFIIGVFLASPQFYRGFMLPEPYGFLEMGHFLAPLLAMFVGLRLLFSAPVRRDATTYWFVLLATLTCLYCAGEEVSWGQHFFGWGTPEAWSEINRQNETNLHNTFGIFEKLPRAIIEVGVIGGGVLAPLAVRYWPEIRTNPWSLFLPGWICFPTAAGALFFKLVDEAERAGFAEILVSRASEALESYLYFFFLVYLVMFARRIRDGEAARQADMRRA